MSLATWRREFYRTPANEVSTNKALEHSIKKWTGLLPKNRKRHEVKLNDCTLRDAKGNILDIDGDSCALCMCYDDICMSCPLSIVSKDGITSPCHNEYLDAMNKNKVTPMIRLLKKAQKKGLVE